MDLPEPEYMTPEQEAAVMDDTDPDLCTCRHGGLPRVFHLSGCVFSVYGIPA